ncbi:DUF6777 domain-containing protein [Streptomyces echinatus]|uniref:DUF6777 domain-containing protein n=1 Tax=Streptomyces echinatus TaxID=67293 RepID=A0A7W9PUW1_9ACTN|nr:DUF6777 domain-containing protein [Streptomyces echinatus]MBB5928331.1 hypothetical protein [Streptomyces echinatus]
MRIPTGTIVCVLAVLFAAGCAGSGVKQTRLGEMVLLQAATDRGPEPFTASTAISSTATAAPRSASPRSTVPVSAAELAAPLRATRTLSGGTPGLYRGSPHVAGCDAERHIGYLAADEARADAFARAAGVTRSALPRYLRGLTPVVLGTDTRVTNHSYRDRRAQGYQAVLQAGTAVLVDDRGVPRVRCACGNPLGPPAPTRGGAGARGTPWAGYRPNKVIVVAPAPRAVKSITIVDSETRTWTERRVGQDVSRDHVVPPPVRDVSPSPPTTAATPSPADGRPSPRDSRPATAPAGTGPSPAGTAAPDGRTDAPSGAAGLADGNPVAPTQEPRAPAPSPARSSPSPPRPRPSPAASSPSPSRPSPSPDPSDRIAPLTMPETADLPDGAGPVPGLPDGAGAAPDGVTASRTGG